MEDVQQTVVDTPVDAGQATEQHTEQTEQTQQPETVVTPAVDAQDAESVREAMRKEMERREAKWNEKMEEERKSAAQTAKDSWIASQGYVHPISGQPIKTEAEYNQALRDKEIMDQYQEKGLPDDVVQELVESKRFREEYQTKQQQEQTEAKQRADFQAFIEKFPDAKAEEIPPSVWADVNSGSSLVDAYTRYENQTLKQKLAALEQQKQIEEQNKANAESSTGSVSGNGTSIPTFFTKKQVDSMSTSEVNKHYDAIVKSMQNPKFYE